MYLLFQKTQIHKEKFHGYSRGLATSFPIVLGYFPVAMAFGLAAKTAGFTHIDAAVISALIFAGASQFALVSMVAGGTPGFFAVVMCLALNVRHLIYGPSLSVKLKTVSQKYLPIVSFGLTDEVFSTSLAKIGQIDKNQQISWLMGLETGAYFTWVFASWLGAYLADIIINYLPAAGSAFTFALPALFITLLVPMMDKETIIPVIVSAIISIVFISNDLDSYAILAAAITGPAVWIALRRSP